MKAQERRKDPEVQARKDANAQAKAKANEDAVREANAREGAEVWATLGKQYRLFPDRLGFANKDAQRVYALSGMAFAAASSPLSLGGRLPRGPTC